MSVSSAVPVRVDRRDGHEADAVSVESKMQGTPPMGNAGNTSHAQTLERDYGPESHANVNAVRTDLAASALGNDLLDPAAE